MCNIYPYLGVSSPFDPSNLHVTSQALTPFNLALLRLAIAFYTFVTLIVTIVHDSVVDNGGPSYFSYFTHLTYVGICAYYWAAGTQTFVFARNIRKREGASWLVSSASEKAGDRDVEDRMMYPLQSWPRPLQALHVWLQTTIYVFPILVTIVYWGLLASSESFSTPYQAYSNTSVHILNTAFALTDILFSRTPPIPWLMLPLVFLALAGYLGVAYLTRATQGIYPYEFLNPAKAHQLLAAYIIGIAIAYCIIFIIIRGIIIIRGGRLRTLRWNFWRKGRRANSEGLEDWEEVEAPGRERGSMSPSKEV
ncbi:hypothetical protein BDZ94DRAFT_1326587 [Collybia nuda]|uniref:Uncharacterized protein n=1 Tax=Collybia nuda TaxID=64659 RepID=A0A9P6C9C0_9AGAR|nr:hypothetical protein BDZ94DRAFT_1326587 [Collybia nuda]